MSLDFLNTKQVAKRYAKATFQLCLEQNMVEDSIADLEKFVALCESHDELKDVVNSPILQRTVQEAAILAVADKLQLGELAKGLLQTLCQRRRLYVLREIVNELKSMHLEHLGVQDVFVKSATPLSEEQEKRLSQELEKALNKPVKLEITIDKNIIGGYSVEVNSKLIDNTVASKLEQIETTMKGIN